MIAVEVETKIIITEKKDEIYRSDLFSRPGIHVLPPIGLTVSSRDLQ